MKHLYTILCLFLISISNLVNLNAQPVNFTSFENFADEAVFTKTSWTSEGFTVPWVNGFDQNRAKVDDAYSHSGNKSLRMFFPASQFGPSNSGGQAPLKVTGKNQYYISYWVRFSDNFSWGTTSEGGKLPGLAGGSNCSGCATCIGTNGFSARLMWRTGGKAVLYLYHMDKGQTCGDNLTLKYQGNDFYFQKGQWYQITERVKVNSGSNNDGEVELWVNQKPALLVTNLKFVTNGDLVDNMYFSTFHGGSTSDWAPTVDCYIWFDDVMITENPSDIFLPLSSNENKDLQKDIKIYPQPLHSGNEFYLNISGIDKIEWLDISGKKLFTSKGNMISTVPSMQEGIYLLKIFKADEILIQRVHIR